MNKFQKIFGNIGNNNNNSNINDSNNNDDSNKNNSDTNENNVNINDDINDSNNNSNPTDDIKKSPTKAPLFVKKQIEEQKSKSKINSPSNNSDNSDNLTYSESNTPTIRQNISSTAMPQTPQTPLTKDFSTILSPSNRNLSSGTILNINANPPIPMSVGNASQSSSLYPSIPNPYSLGIITPNGTLPNTPTLGIGSPIGIATPTTIPQIHPQSPQQSQSLFNIFGAANNAGIYYTIYIYKYVILICCDN